MNKRALIVLLVGLLTGGVIYAARRPMQRELLSYSVLHMDAPREQALDEVFDGSSDPVGFLINLWSAAKIPQRHYVIEHLRSNQPLCDANWSRIWPVVGQALGSADLDEREPAMMILDRHDPRAALQVARFMLADVDPEVRSLALRTARLSPNDPQSQTILTQSLTDPDKHVRALAQATLASSNPKPASSNPTPASATPTLVSTVTTAAPLPATPIENPISLPASPTLTAVDFSLLDLQDHPMRLTALRGKTVIVNFWLTGCGPCTTEMPTLIELQTRHPSDLAILSINVDGIGDEDAPDSNTTAPDPTAAVKAKVDKLALNFPVAIDHQGTVVGAYEGTGVPLSVLIDAQGKIRRRFVGPRSLETWEQMLGEIQNHK